MAPSPNFAAPERGDFANPRSLEAAAPRRGSFQRTFGTPLKQLPAFVAILLDDDPPITGASVLVEAAVFTPKHLEALLSSYGLQLEYGTDRTITVLGARESQALLEAALADWLDFYFLPEPRRFLLYADHDEYTTLFAVHKGRLSRLASALTTAGFVEISGYVRAL